MEQYGHLDEEVRDLIRTYNTSPRKSITPLVKTECNSLLPELRDIFSNPIELTVQQMKVTSVQGGTGPGALQPSDVKDSDRHRGMRGGSGPQ